MWKKAFKEYYDESMLAMHFMLNELYKHGPVDPRIEAKIEDLKKAKEVIDLSDTVDKIGEKPSFKVIKGM
jgi:hypothetical protein